MARPARILLAGTTAATALFAAAATSAQQAQVLNNQLQLGDVVAGQTLNVVTTSDQVTASTTATGAQLAGGVQGGDLQVTSRQEMQGNAAASTRLDISGEVGGPVSISTQATGTDAQLTVDGGTMTADLTQVAGAVTVGADSHVEAVAGRMLGGGSISSTAMANSVALGSTTGRIQGSVVQTSAAIAEAESSVTVQYAPARTDVVATAASNSLNSTSTVGSTDLSVTQTATGARTQAAAFVSAGNAWDVQASAQAMGNNAAISNQGGSADVVAVQDNRTYVRAQTQLSAYDFGGGAAVAYGAGNALQVGQNDVTANIDVTQVTNGGVEVIATFDGTQGYDGAASATAVGNAVVGYACSDCGANLTVNNSQTNLDGVSATSATRVAGAGRAVVSGATATGNSATFYVSRPSQ